MTSSSALKTVLPASNATVIVMLAYNAEATLEKTVQDIPEEFSHNIILTDDGSQDKTVETARRLNLTVIQHQTNKGCGANQKTCYRAALETGADSVVMIHPDYQYDCRVIPFALGFLKIDICDIIPGSRIRTRSEALEKGMPF